MGQTLTPNALASGSVAGLEVMAPAGAEPGENQDNNVDPASAEQQSITADSPAPVFDLEAVNPNSDQFSNSFNTPTNDNTINTNQAVRTPSDSTITIEIDPSVRYDNTADGPNLSNPQYSNNEPAVAKQHPITADSPAPVFDPEALNPNSDTYATSNNPNLGVQTQESQTSEMSHAGNVAAGALGLTSDHVDRSGRAGAAGILDKGNGGNLPAPGFANRAELAATITDPRITAHDALELTPFSSNATSTQVLTETAESVGSLGRVIAVVGNALGPATGAIESFVYTPDDATVGEYIANTMGGALRELDDMAASGLATVGAAIATPAVGGFMMSTGIGIPAGTYVIASTPVVAASSGISASIWWDTTPMDSTIDSFIDNRFEPFITNTIDRPIEFIQTQINFFSDNDDNLNE